MRQNVREFGNGGRNFQRFGTKRGETLNSRNKLLMDSGVARNFLQEGQILDNFSYTT